MDRARIEQVTQQLWGRRMERLRWLQREDEASVESKSRKRLHKTLLLAPEEKERKEEPDIRSWWRQRMELEERNRMSAFPMQDLRQVIRQLLRESRVIGDIVNDFLPCMDLNVRFFNKEISLGDHVSRDDVQFEPLDIEDKKISSETLPVTMNATYVCVMTELGTACESLLWLTTVSVYVNPFTDQLIGGLEWPPLVRYRPPTSNMIAFIMFKQNESHDSITLPFMRDIFSTRSFATINHFGEPLGAAFCYVRE